MHEENDNPQPLSSKNIPDRTKMKSYIDENGKQIWNWRNILAGDDDNPNVSIDKSEIIRLSMTSVKTRNCNSWINCVLLCTTSQISKPKAEHLPRFGVRIEPSISPYSQVRIHRCTRPVLYRHLALQNYV